MFGSKKIEPDLDFGEKMKMFCVTYWRGIVCILAPLVLLPIVLPEGKKSGWNAYCLCLMAVYWVSECIPLSVTAFFPVIIFPLSGVMSTYKTCMCYINDAVILFVGSLVLASAVEQSGLHKRLAYLTVRLIGYSHLKLMAAVCTVTTFVSMWITNTAATVMMVPITFALLGVFEDQGVLKIYKKNALGEDCASDITTVYFCCLTYSATMGGIGTLVGTGTNLAFKGIFMTEFPLAPEYLSFPNFSFFGVPLMITLKTLSYFYYIVVYFGFLRPNSELAKKSKIPAPVIELAKRRIDGDWKKLGGLSVWEVAVIILFGGAMVCFFCRSPQIFVGWGDIIESTFKRPERFVRDSALAFFVGFLMCLCPNSCAFFKNFTAKYHEDLPKEPIHSVINWTLLNSKLPYAFMFLLGGGFALSEAAKISGLNEIIGSSLQQLESLPLAATMFIVILVTILITNFASNVAVVNVLGPISLTLARKIHVNPLWLIIAVGFSSSFCYMLPVGTPGNLIVQSAAKVTTTSMIKAGVGPTVVTIFATWAFVMFYAPIIWPDLTTIPFWVAVPGIPS